MGAMARPRFLSSFLKPVPVAAAVVFLVTFGLFSFGITGGHLHLDDWGYTYGCGFVRGGLSGDNMLRSFLDFGNGGIWMPLTYMTYMADMTFWGGGWLVHHAANAVLHGLNAVLVFWFLLRTAGLIAKGDRRTFVWASLAGALVWSLHPMRAEAVVWVASRKEELWAFFALSASLCWITFLERGGGWRYWVTVGLFVLACLSKPTAVCFPLLALVIQFGLFGRARFRLRHYVPLFFIALAVGLIAVHSQTNPTGFDRIDVSDTSFAWRILNAAVSLGLYLVHAVAPAGVHMDYRAVFGGWPLDGVLGLSVLAATVASVSLLLALSRCAAWRRPLLFACAWFLLSIAPVLGLLGATGDKAYADRYTYLPAVALSLLIAVLLAGLRGRTAAVAAGTLLAAEVAFALPLIRSFESDYPAYSRVLRHDPKHWRALRVVGCEYCARQNRMDEGIEMLRRSLGMRPSQTTADRLAYSLACRGADGDFAEVRRLGGAAAADASCDKGGMMLDALGIAAMREGDDAAAVRYFSSALTAPRRTHSNVHSMLNLGLALANIGRRDEALQILAKLRHVGNARVKERAADAMGKISAGSAKRLGWR